MDLQAPEFRTWYIGWRVHGKIYQRSTKTTDKKMAEAELTAVEALADAAKSGRSLKALYEALTGSIESRRTIQTEVADWLAEAKPSVSAPTFARYAATSTRFIEQVGREQPSTT